MSGLKDTLIRNKDDSSQEKLTLEEKALLDLYRTSENKKKIAVLKALKGKNTDEKLLDKISDKMHSDDKDGNIISTPLLGFTFFYSVSIYLLLLSFYFWQIRNDIKPEKK